MPLVGFGIDVGIETVFGIDGLILFAANTVRLLELELELKPKASAVVLTPFATFTPAFLSCADVAPNTIPISNYAGPIS